jgi:hypothetical protein
MMKRSHPVPFAVALRTPVAVIAVAAAPCFAYAQSADLVLCDRLAADPADPDRPADVKGVAEVAPSDIATAIKFCKVASGASRRAMYQLGRAYAANRQVPEAIAAWRKAAGKGSTAAMVELGVASGNGAGVPQDEAQARKLFERAAQAGNPRGISNLATLGGGASADPAQARGLLARAGETNAEAQYQLGLMIADGVGGPKDDVTARALFEKAAAQKSPRGAGADGRLRPARPRRRQGCNRGESLLRKGRSPRQRRRQSGAEAAGVPLRDQGQAREFRHQSLFLASVRNSRKRHPAEPSRIPPHQAEHPAHSLTKLEIAVHCVCIVGNIFNPIPSHREAPITTLVGLLSRREILQRSK